MGNKFVVAAGGNSNASGTWSNISSVSPGGDGVPTAADDVVLDATSGNLTINAAMVCRSFDCNNLTTYAGTITHNSFNVAIGDGTAGANNIALRLAGTYNKSSTTLSSFSFISTSATQQSIYTGGKVLANFSFNPSSNGSYILQDNLAADGAASTTLTHTRGTLNLNDKTVSLGVYSLSGTLARTLTCGAALISLSAGTGLTAWLNTTTTNLTFNPDTSTITCTGSGATFAGGGLTYNNVVMNGAGTAVITGVNSYANLTRTGTAVKTCVLQLSANTTVSSAFTVNSNSDTNRVLVTSDVKGTARTITAGSLVATNTVDWQDITGAGTATWTVAGSGATAFGDCGGNTGITMSASVAQTATGTASLSFSTHAFTPGRAGGPLPQDDVSFPNAFIGGRVVTQDMPRAGRSITFSCTGSPAFAPSVAWSLFGSLDLTGVGSVTGTALASFEGRSSYTFKSSSATWGSSVTLAITAPGGTVTLQDALTLTSTSANSLILNNGTFDAATFNVGISGGVNISGTFTRELKMGAGTWTLSGTGTVWNAAVTTGLTLNAGASTLAITNTSATTKNHFPGASQTYNATTISGDNVTVSVTGSTNLGALTVNTAGLTTGLIFGQSATYTISSLATNGSLGNLAKMLSNSAGNAFTLSCPNPVDVDYMSIKDSTAAGSTPFYAGANSTDVSGNTNWTFTARPVVSTGRDMSLLLGVS